MSAALQDSPKRRSRRWLVGLSLAALGVSIWLAEDYRRVRSQSAADFALIQRNFPLDPTSGSKQVIAQIGKARFWRAVRDGIRGRSDGWEARFRDWLTFKQGRQPKWLQAVMSTLLPLCERRWKQQDDRLGTALMLIELDLKETAAPLLPELMGLFGSKDFNHRSSGLRALRQLRGSAAPALPALFHRLESAGGSTFAFAEAINDIDPDSVRTSQHLVELLPKVTAHQRSGILPVLGDRARRHRELATNLWPTLQDPDSNVVVGGIVGLARAGLLTPSYLEQHRAGFRSADTRTRWLSLELVAHSGTSAGGFVPELRAIGLRAGPNKTTALSSLLEVVFRSDAPADQRFAATEAILASDAPHDAWSAIDILFRDFRFGPTKVVPLFTGALANANAEVRTKAAETLGNLGSTARSALPELRALRQDPEKQVRDAVESALPKIGE